MKYVLEKVVNSSLALFIYLLSLQILNYAHSTPEFHHVAGDDGRAPPHIFCQCAQTFDMWMRKFRVKSINNQIVVVCPKFELFVIIMKHFSFESFYMFHTFEYVDIMTGELKIEHPISQLPEISQKSFSIQILRMAINCHKQYVWCLSN